MAYGIPGTNLSTPRNTGGLRCFVCPGRSVCLEWHRSLSLRLQYDEVLGALDCLDDLLTRPAWRFALGREHFCAFHDGDDSFYFVCREYVVLRLSAEEARVLRSELTRARDNLEQDYATPGIPPEAGGISPVQT